MDIIILVPRLHT